MDPRALLEARCPAPARALTHEEDGEPVWRRCEVLSYNRPRSTLEVRWGAADCMVKCMRRLDVVFDGEDEVLFMQRRAIAHAWKRLAEADMRCGPGPPDAPTRHGPTGPHTSHIPGARRGCPQSVCGMPGIFQRICLWEKTAHLEEFAPVARKRVMPARVTFTAHYEPAVSSTGLSTIGLCLALFGVADVASNSRVKSEAKS